MGLVSGAGAHLYRTRGSRNVIVCFLKRSRFDLRIIKSSVLWDPVSAYITAIIPRLDGVRKIIKMQTAPTSHLTPIILTVIVRTMHIKLIDTK